MKATRLGLLSTAAMLLLLSGPASAGLVYNSTADFYLQDGFPAETEVQVHGIPGQTNENVPTANGVLLNSNPEINAIWQGNTNINASAGFATIQGPDLARGSFGNYGSIDFSLANDYAFTDLLFDVQLAFDTPSTQTPIADQLVVTAFFSNGTSTSYDNWLNDEAWKEGTPADNSLMVVADEGLFITHVLIETLLGGNLVNGLFQTKHYQVSGAQECGPDTECGGEGNTPVPVPSALPLMLSGIAGLGYLARSRRKRN